MSQDSLWTIERDWRKKFICHRVHFGTPSNLVTFSPPVDQLLCSILHKNGKRTYYVQWALYCVQHYDISVCWWLHEVQWDLQWVLCTAFWSMDMTGVYACLFEAVCDVTTVPSHLKTVWLGALRWSLLSKAKARVNIRPADTDPVFCTRVTRTGSKQRYIFKMQKRKTCLLSCRCAGQTIQISRRCVSNTV